MDCRMLRYTFMAQCHILPLLAFHRSVSMPARRCALEPCPPFAGKVAEDMYPLHRFTGAVHYFDLPRWLRRSRESTLPSSFQE